MKIVHLDPFLWKQRIHSTFKMPPKSMTSGAGAGGKKTIEETYQKMSQYEHILTVPDTYIGSIEKTELETWIYNPDLEKMEFRNIAYIPGLYKIFDEILVNALDQHVRTELDASVENKVTQIRVNFDAERNVIRVMNNGDGVPVAMHAEHQVYVPEMIFGTLLTGSNYDQSEEKVVGGKNGYGAKLANIYSTHFMIETVDAERKKKYIQTFERNMSVKGEPAITKSSVRPYTLIEFSPDLARFGLERLDGDDTMRYMMKRVIDATACTKKTVSIFLNDVKLECKSLEKYVSYYLPETVERVYEEVSDRWEIVCAVSPDQRFEQVSFVNGISTCKGGKHVDYVVTGICKKLIALMAGKRSKVELKASHIKDNMFLFVRSTIVNPAFDSQIKEYLTTNVLKFGSRCEMSDRFIEKLSKTSIVDHAQRLLQFKENIDLQKTSGRKVVRISGIPKLDDANMAGTPESQKCTLILTEGDSAKGLAVSGLSVVGRDYFGVFPLKGKLLNVRGEKMANVLKNEEIENLVKILGLQYNTSPRPKSLEETLSKLRYGRVMIFTDQDVDGFHIKGLLSNFFDVFWPELLEKPDFLIVLSTPILKVFKGKQKIDFYTLTEYENWQKETPGSHTWKAKYYKGLGTSTSADAREYFEDFEAKKICYTMSGGEGAVAGMGGAGGGTGTPPMEVSGVAKDALDLAFNDKRAQDRKAWLSGYDRQRIIQQSQKVVRFDEFVHNELIHFSEYDNHRSIPSMCDGLKPSQRKVLCAAFKRNLREDIKVAQFAGYVSEHMAYHHGEASLVGTIVGMAQDFVGSNNINLLVPNGQFGTRIQGGKDAASARYIFTYLAGLTTLIYHPKDAPLYTYVEDDGQTVEPEYYVPVIPMILVNGSVGIGTGYSTDIPQHNPMEIMDALKARMEEEKPFEPMAPWTRGFSGTFSVKEGTEGKRYENKGSYRILDDTTVEVSELPVGLWTDNYKIYLESIVVGSTSAPSAKAAKAVAKAEGGGDGTSKRSRTTASAKQTLQRFTEHHTDHVVRFVLHFKKEDLDEWRVNLEEFEKYLKLTQTISYTNLTLYDSQCRLKQYSGTPEIMEEFYLLRLGLYGKRREHMRKVLQQELDMTASKVRFIEEIIARTLDVMYREDEAIIADLEERGYPKFEASGGEKGAFNYDYLLNMRIRTLTKKRLDELRREHESKLAELRDLESKTPTDLWKEDLGALREEYTKMIEAFQSLYEEERAKTLGTQGSGGAKKKRVVAKKRA